MDLILTCFGEYWELLAEELDLVQQAVDCCALHARPISPTNIRYFS